MSELLVACAVTRRTLLGTGAAAAAGLLLGVRTAESAPSPALLADWIRVAPNGDVILYSNAQEMGQGASSAVAQLLVEELDVAWARVRVEHAPLADAYGMWGTSQGVGGSSTMRLQFDKLRKAGAAARAMLVEEAAARWKVPAGTCRTEQGRVLHDASKRSVAYGTLAADAAKRAPPASPSLKPRERWQVVGNDVPRLDIPSKVDGSARYAIDMQLPGMLTATLLQAPRFGARLESVDEAPARAITGVRRVLQMRGVQVRLANGSDVTLPDAVIVVADDFWSAQRGASALQPVWSEVPGLDDDQVATRLRQAALADSDPVLPVDQRNAPDAPQRRDALRAAHAAARAKAVRSVAVDYALPYLAHAQMEPLTAVAHVAADGAQIWSGTQAQSNVRASTAALLGLAPEKVTVHTLLSGGAFGRRFQLDFTLQAAWIARAMQVPVKLVWSREEDFRQDRYRPAAQARLSCGLDERNHPVGLHVAAASANSYYAAELVGERVVHGLLYDIEGTLVQALRHDLPVPIGAWRSVTHSVNAFLVESFIDELAAAAGEDGLAFRRKLLAHEPRALRLLQVVADAVRWSAPRAAGQGIGLAVWRGFGSYVAQAVDLTITGDRKIRLGRIVCAFDCGTAVSPGNIRAQGEGSIIMALSAALRGEVPIVDGAASVSNFHEHPLLTLAETPPIEIHIRETPDAPVGGAGEPMTAPLPAALANALAAAGAPRIRRLPLTRDGWSLA